MSFFFQAGAPTPITPKILSTTGATVVAGSATTSTSIDRLRLAEVAGATPTVSVEDYDGTTSIYLKKTVPMTALGDMILDTIQLDPGHFLRLTASTANQVHVTGVQRLALPNA